MVEQAEARGQPLPGWFEDAPDPMPGDDFWVGAFWDLSTERQTGFGAGPIPWSAVVAYAEHAGLDEDVSAAFVAVIRRADATFLKWAQAERVEQERKQAAARPNGGKAR